MKRLKMTKTDLIGTVETGAEEASLDGRKVHDDGILLVVAAIARDADDAVDTWERTNYYYY